MDSSSGSGSEVSDSEIPDYEAKSYLMLKNKAKVKVSNNLYRCPFCRGKKKQDYGYKDLLQHATGIGASNRSKGKAKANHRALARFLRNDLSGEAGPSMQLMVIEQPNARPSKKEDLYVYPWMAVLVNLRRSITKEGKYTGETQRQLKDRLQHFHPIRVFPLWNYRGFTGNAVMEFGKDWNAFNNSMAVENYFAANHRGKNDWKNDKHRKSEMYGWVARADDYNKEDMISEYLQKNGDLKTITELTEAESQKTEKLVESLANVITKKSQHLQELESKFNITTMSLERMMEDYDKMQLSHNEEIQKMQDIARQHSRWIIKNNEKLRLELEDKRKELDARNKQLDKLVAETESERRELDIERRKNAMVNDSLELASLEQRKADENVYKLLEQHKKEKEANLEKILQLEKQLDAKQKLELEIERLKGNLGVMQHIGVEGSDDRKNKMEELRKELEEKEEEMESLNEMNVALFTKERRSNDELQAARKELIEGLKEMVGARAIIGIKKMGELDLKPFRELCNGKYSGGDIKAVELCSHWQEELKNPDWYPFRVVSNELVLNKDDEKLNEVKETLGEKVHDAVVTALRELIEYNGSGRYTVPEIWNFKANRKATMLEAVQYVLKQWKVNKRKRTM